MNIKGWKLYNHAAIPSTSPDVDPDTEPIWTGTIWKVDEKPLLARWTTDFDCGYETNWWYVVKDVPFDISSLKAKRRYEINKGIKNFDVRVIDPCCYKKELYDVQVRAFEAYPKKYRPKVNQDDFLNKIDGWKKYTVFGAFFRETGKLEGYSLCDQNCAGFVDFCVQKTNPEYERYSVNAALVEAILGYYSDLLKKGGMVCDGARSINHETHFQDYLEKYFGFRKAYCKLHVSFCPGMKWVVDRLYSMRTILKKMDGIKIIHLLNSVLTMREFSVNESIVKERNL